MGRKFLPLLLLAILGGCDAPAPTYDDRLNPLVTSSVLTQEERALALLWHERLSAAPDTPIPSDIEATLAAARGRHEADLALKKTPFGYRAIPHSEEAIKDIAQRLLKATEDIERKLPSCGEDERDALEARLLAVDRWPAFSLGLFPPWALLWQRSKDEAIDPVAASRRTAAVLLDVAKDLAAYDIRPPDGDPLVVVHLANQATYQAFVDSGATTFSGAAPLAHYDAAIRQLITHGEASEVTLRHEAVHQLVHVSAQRLAPFLARSFWLHEGFADWIAGDVTTEGGQRFEAGRLRQSTLETLRSLTFRRKTLSLSELVGCTFFARRTFAESDPAKVDALYAQGYLLVHFLQRFKRRADGTVILDPTVPGDYQQRFLRLLVAERNGESGPAAFRRYVATDEETEARLAAEFAAYQTWLLKKALTLGHWKDGKLLPWFAAGGRREDDLLEL